MKFIMQTLTQLYAIPLGHGSANKNSFHTKLNQEINEGAYHEAHIKKIETDEYSLSSGGQQVLIFGSSAT